MINRQMRRSFTQGTELMKAETAHHHEDEKVRALYEASYEGSVTILNSLIQHDPLILHKINSRTTFTETPLHISASIGHLEFSKALLTYKPKLALELDSFRSTALHLASAEGHVDIVKELLLVCEDACLVPDQEGRIPLHYAVIRGRLEVVRQLARVKPESLRIRDSGKSVFHLCVTYNHLEILKAVVELDNIDTDTCELLSSRDLDGRNTILHLAIMFKQIKTIRYLLSIPKIREASNLKNDMGFTAHDILQRIPQDFKSLEMQILMKTSFESEKKEMDIPQAPTTPDVDEAVRPSKRCWWRSILKSMGKWFKHNSDWLEEMRGNLSLVATVISTITFQAVTNPPGGVIQQGISTNLNNSTSNSSSIIYYSTTDPPGPLSCLMIKDVYGYDTDYVCPGEAVIASRDPYSFRFFLIYNTISFVASLGVTLLLVSGVPLKNKVVMWMLCIGMCITLTSLVLTYLQGLFMLSPDKLWDSTDKVYNIASWTWLGLLGLVGVYIVVGFLIWLVKKCIKLIKHRMSMSARNHNRNVSCSI